MHASGRNSGVLHAGFYYSPDSLKAKFCREGNKELRKVAKNHGIPVRNVGKVVVARNNDENIRLDKLFERGIKNGVDIEVQTDCIVMLHLTTCISSIWSTFYRTGVYL